MKTAMIVRRAVAEARKEGRKALYMRHPGSGMFLGPRGRWVRARNRGARPFPLADLEAVYRFLAKNRTVTWIPA